MRILLCNKFYYRKGGDCAYTLGLEKLLKDRGHDVAIFAMKHPENLPSPWEKYFPPMVDFSSLRNKVGFFSRTLGDGATRRLFSSLLDDFKPQVVHLGNIHSQLSPMIAEIAHSRGIRVVWTLHDYKLLCPRYDCRRPGFGNCELCFTNKKNVLKFSCMKNSRAASFLAFIEARRWNAGNLDKNTDAFVCPSRFMLEKMRLGGFNSSKLHHICNFIDVASCLRDNYSDREDYYCFAGRLSEEKGIRTLCRVAAGFDMKLKVLGEGPLSGKLPVSDSIEYLGRQDWDSLKEIVGKARFLVVPSEWYENNPLSVIEALSLGTPVLGADIGGIPELIEPENGRCFTSGDESSLRDGLVYMRDHKFDYGAIADKSQRRFSAGEYYGRLMSVYGQD